MAEPPSNSGDNGRGARPSFWAESAQSAKAWAAVAAAFLAVVALAGWLFSRHQSNRQAQIDAQYAQNAARYAQQLELKYRNYRAVVDNVTRVLSSAGRAAVQEQQRALGSARAAQQRASERTAHLKARLELAAARRKKAELLAKQHKLADQKASGAASALEQVYTAAESAVRASQAALERANQTFVEAATKLLVKQQALNQADLAVTAARRAVDEAAAASPVVPSPPSATSPAAPPASASPLAAAVPSVSPVPSTSAPATVLAAPVVSATPPAAPPTAPPPPPNLDASLLALKEAEKNREDRKNDVELAGGEFRSAQEKANEAWEEASGRDADADKAWLDLQIADDVLVTTKQSDEDAEKKSQQAKTIYQSSVDDYRRGLAEAQKEKTKADAVQDVPPSVEADSYLKGLESLVLPSHVGQLRQCQGLADVKAVRVCVAQRIAELNDVQGMEIVECASTSNSVSVSEDKRYLLIPPSTKEPGTASTLPACGRVKLRRMLTGAEEALDASMKQTADGAFDSVLLLRRDGTTLHSLDLGSNLRVLALPGFKESDADASRVLSHVAIGTSEYRAFLQPIRLRLATPDADDKTAPAARDKADLVLCGLAPESRLVQASYAIPLPLYLWFVLFLGVGLLSLPLAKLWLLGPKTSFTRFDVTLLATSAGLLTLLAPVVTLAFVAHNRLDERAERQVTTVATDIEQRLRAQISTAASRLHQFNSNEGRKLPYQLLDRPSELGLAAQRRECMEAGGSLVRGILFDGEAQAKSVCERTFHRLNDGVVATPGSPLPVPVAPAADWRLIFLLDQDGAERVKFVPDGHDSTAVSVQSRGYFQRAIHGITPCLDAECKIRGAPELVRSITSGRLVLMVAQPVCTDSYPCTAQAGEEPRPIGVAALETDMRPLRSLTLPLGMQAAVVDASGRIMLHSNNDAHHEQNLFGEVDQPEELRASLLTKVPANLEINYLGQLSRLHIEPLRLRGTGWSVVTIAPTSIVDVATTDMVLASVFGYGLLLLVLLLLLCCALVVGQGIKWIWYRDESDQGRDETPGIGLRPHAQRSEAYAALGLWSIRSGAVLCGLAMFSTPYLPTTVGLVAAVVLCVVAVQKLTVIAKFKPHAGCSEEFPRTERVARPWREFLPLTYTLCIAGLAELFIMAPAAVLFNGAYVHVVDSLVRAEHNHLATSLSRRPDCFGALPQADGTRTIPSNCADVFSSGEEHTSTSAAARRSVSELLQSRLLSPLPYVADFLPAIGPAELNDRGRLYRTETIGQPNPAPSELVSERQLGSMVLVSSLDGSAKAESDLPPLFGIRYHTLTFLLLLLVAAACVAAAYAVGLKSLRRLYFLDLLMKWRERVIHDVASVIAKVERRGKDATRRKVLIRHPSASVQEALAKQPESHILKLDDAGPEPPAHESADVLYVVQDLAPRVYDEAMVTRLVQVALWPAKVVVLSVNDPALAGTDAPVRSWSAALERFEMVEATAGGTTPTQRASEPPSGGAPVQAPSSPQMTRAWLESSDVERRLLAELAINGYAAPHPANIPALKTLTTRGLLDPDTLTIAHQELARIARESTSPEDQTKWAEADRGTAWASLRVPLSTGVVALLVTLTASKPELGVASAVVPTLAAGLPTVLRILGQLVASKAEPG